MTRESRVGCVCDTMSCVSCVCARSMKSNVKTSLKRRRAVVVGYTYTTLYGGRMGGRRGTVEISRFARYKPTTRTRRAHF